MRPQNIAQSGPHGGVRALQNGVLRSAMLGSFCSPRAMCRGTGTHYLKKSGTRWPAGCASGLGPNAVASNLHSYVGFCVIETLGLTRPAEPIVQPSQTICTSTLRIIYPARVAQSQYFARNVSVLVPRPDIIIFDEGGDQFGREQVFEATTDLTVRSGSVFAATGAPPNVPERSS